MVRKHRNGKAGRPLVHQTTGDSSNSGGDLFAGEKLPNLVNASLTIVPDDGIYCFGALL
jgi:hypothetical protein